MSTVPPNQPYPQPPGTPPPMYYYGAPQPARSASGCLLVGSVILNVVALIVIVVGCFGTYFGGWGLKGSSDPLALSESHHSGKSETDADKVAIIRLDGVIVEGALDYPFRQIEQASKDDQVKAVVFRIASPGGSITASDDLWRRLRKLRDGDPLRNWAGKPIVVSMGSLAASGGYYIAMPGEYLFAERTTMTGSIGVYAAFPNVKGLGEKVGFEMITIKQGAIKDSGSPFKDMTEKERTVWQSSINHAYNQFVDVVVEGRTRDGKLLLAHQPHERFDYEPVQVPGEEKIGDDTLQRYIADGGIYSAEEAEELGLIDKIGTLDDAIAKARSLGGLGEDGRTIEYKRPKTLSEVLLGVESNKSTPLTQRQLHKGLIPRMWYLAPGCELAGVLASIEE